MLIIKVKNNDVHYEVDQSSNVYITVAVAFPALVDKEMTNNRLKRNE